MRTLLDRAGLLTQVALSAIQVHDVALCRPLLEQAPVLRPGDLLLGSEYEWKKRRDKPVRCRE